MASINWPATLPQQPLLSGFNQSSSPSNVLRSATDEGAQKVREIHTKRYYLCEFNMLLNDTQVETLRDFYTITTKSGTNKFNFTDFVDNTSVEYRFLEPPRISKHSIKWMANMRFEIFP